MNILFKGVLIGLSIAAPVGPIGLLCMRRSIEQGRLAGLVTGLGAATADATYSSIAAFGLTAVFGFLLAHAAWLRSAGGAALCFLGVRIYLRGPLGRPDVGGGAEGLVAAFLSTFALTLANPLTFLSFLAIFAGFGVAESQSYPAAAVLVGGVFAGSSLWWLFLSVSAASLGRHFSDRWTSAADRASGGAIVVFGLLALAAPLFK